MSVSSKIKALLAMMEKKQIDLAEHFGMTKQSMANKMRRDSWSAGDLISVADFCGCKIAFICPDGQHIYLSSENEHKKSPGDYTPGPTGD